MAIQNPLASTQRLSTAYPFPCSSPTRGRLSEVKKTTAVLKRAMTKAKNGTGAAEMDAVGITVKDTTNTWNTRCLESVKRETELYKMVEAAVMDEKQEERERGMIRDLLWGGGLRKRREENDETRNLIE